MPPFNLFKSHAFTSRRLGDWRRLPWEAARASSAVVLIFMVGLYLALKFFLGRFMRNPDMRTLMISGLTATGLTELLYLIFKQIFFISLTQGLIIW